MAPFPFCFPGLALFITSAIALHNIPEGLAVSLVHIFHVLLPAGLGFAAGAMIRMVFAEIIPEAQKDAPPSAVAIAIALALCGLLAIPDLETLTRAGVVAPRLIAWSLASGPGARLAILG